MGGTASKKQEHNLCRPKSQEYEILHNHHGHTGSAIIPRYYTDKPRSGSVKITTSHSVRQSEIDKSPDNVNSFVTDVWGSLKRTNNSSPSISTDITSLTDGILKNKQSKNMFATPSTIRTASLKSLDERTDYSTKSGSKEKLKWKDVLNLAEDENSTADQKLVGFSGDRSDTNEPTYTNISKTSGSVHNTKLNSSVKKLCMSDAIDINSWKVLEQLAFGIDKQEQGEANEEKLNKTSPVVTKRKRQNQKNHLCIKPPTPPNKPQAQRNFIANRRSLIPNRRRLSEPFDPKINDRRSTSPTPSTGSLTSRRSSLPIPSKINDWIPTPNPSATSSPTASPRRINQSVDEDQQTTLTGERSTCLSRIEYTFYINDTEENQRPFYDRRIEAVARATCCNICLHKPTKCHKPVFYKGNRVIPVTITSRTMVALKRCIARLDIQYPHYNVKAFCPPDMY